MRCAICGCDPCATPGFCDACRKVDRDPKVIRERKRATEQLPRHWESMDVGTLSEALNDPERTRRQRGGHAPQATYDAVQYALRTGGMRALKTNERRVSELSERQLKDLFTSLQKAGAEAALLLALSRIFPDVRGRGRTD